MIGEPTHTTKEMAPCPNFIDYHLTSEVSIMFIVSYVTLLHTALRINNCSKSTPAIHVYRIKRKKWPRPSYINYHLKSQVSITLRCQLCSTHYKVVQIKNCSKSTSAIKAATTKSTNDFHFKGKPSHAIAKSTLFAVNKIIMNETQRRTLVSP